MGQGQGGPSWEGLSKPAKGEHKKKPNETDKLKKATNNWFEINVYGILVGGNGGE